MILVILRCLGKLFPISWGSPAQMSFPLATKSAFQYSSGMIRGILFDMDGVLVDSEEFILKAAMAFFSEIGVETKPEDFTPFVGTGEDRYLGGVADQYGVQIDITRAKERTYELYDQLCRGNLSAMDGVHEYITWCRDKGLKTALATSADKVKMLVNLREIGLESKYFDFMINGLDIERKKPFPDIYIAAAKGIGIPAEHCMVIEDAVSGVKAAKAAGCSCVGVTSSFPRDVMLQAGADRAVDSLRELMHDDTLKTG